MLRFTELFLINSQTWPAPAPIAPSPATLGVSTTNGSNLGWTRDKFFGLQYGPHEAAEGNCNQNHKYESIWIWFILSKTMQLFQSYLPSMRRLSFSWPSSQFGQSWMVRSRRGAQIPSMFQKPKVSQNSCCPNTFELVQAYQWIEFFAGSRMATKCVQSRGYAATCIDFDDYDKNGYSAGKGTCFDILSPSGFLPLALKTFHRVSFCFVLIEPVPRDHVRLGSSCWG